MTRYNCFQDSNDSLEVSSEGTLIDLTCNECGDTACVMISVEQAQNLIGQLTSIIEEITKETKDD